MEEKSEDCKAPEDLFNGLKVTDSEQGESASPMVSDPKDQHSQSKLLKDAEAHPQEDHGEEECFHDCSASFEEEQAGAHMADNKASDDSSSELDEEYLIELEKNMPEEEKQKRREESAKLKEEGNEQFKRGEYMEAESSYSQALQMCPACFQKDRSVLFSNRAAARMKQDKKETAITDCSKGKTSVERALLRLERQVGCVFRPGSPHTGAFKEAALWDCIFRGTILCRSHLRVNMLSSGLFSLFLIVVNT